MTRITEMPPQVPPLPSRQSNDERRAAALAEITQMRDDLMNAHAELGSIQAECHRLEDQLTMVMEDRNRYRVEALSVRAKLIELATSMANISLQCRTAEGIVVSVHELTQANGVPTTETLDRLEAELNGTGTNQ